MYIYTSCAHTSRRIYIYTDADAYDMFAQIIIRRNCGLPQHAKASKWTNVWTKLLFTDADGFLLIEAGVNSSLKGVKRWSKHLI